MPDNQPCLKHERQQDHGPHHWSTPGRSFAAGATYHECEGWNTHMRFACRFCEHNLGAHNLNEGCPYCACMGTIGECSPRTEDELNAKIRSRYTVLPRFKKVKLMPNPFSHDPALSRAMSVTADIVSPVAAGSVSVDVAHLRTLRSAILATHVEPPFPGSVWAVVDRDHSESITSVHRTEIDALRVLNGRGFGRVVELPYGKTLEELVAQH